MKKRNGIDALRLVAVVLYVYAAAASIAGLYAGSAYYQTFDSPYREACIQDQKKCYYQDVAIGGAIGLGLAALLAGRAEQLLSQARIELDIQYLAEKD